MNVGSVPVIVLHCTTQPLQLLMNKHYFTVLLLFVFNTAFSQQPELEWARVFNSNNFNNYRDYSNGRSVTVDRQGNVYSAGLFMHTVDFDPGPGFFNLSGAGYGDYGIYISKLSAAGTFLWAIQIPVLVEFGAIEIKVDQLDNVYLASDLRHSADMDPGSAVYMLNPIGAKDAFVAKYDPNGNLVWAKQFGGPGDTVPHADALDIDNDNNVIICGGFNNTVDFDPGSGTFNLTSTAHIQSYIAKLNSNGDFIWARQFGNSPVVYSGATITDVRCDRLGTIYTVGTFAGNCDFDPGAGNYPLQARSLRDGFISKLDASGNFIWAKRIGNTTNDYFQYAESRGIEIDANNNVYTTGDFAGTFDFDPGPGSQLATSNSARDWYILKLNTQGDFAWVDVFGGSDSEVGADVAVDKDNNVYGVGGVSNMADMDPGPGVYTVSAASMLVKVNSNGGFIYAAPFKSITNGSSLTRRMIVDPSYNIYIAGYVSGTVDFDPGSNVYPLTGSADQSPIVLKLIRCKNITTSTLIINTCSNYTLNNELFDTSGIYVRIIPNRAGCDSVITLHLTINKKSTQQSIAICQGQSFFAGGANQTNTGTYKDTLTTIFNCDSIVTTILTVNPSPLPNLGSDRNLCAGSKIVITPGIFATYEWQDMSTAPVLTINGAGKYWVQVTNSFKCSATDTFIIGSILPAPANFLKKTDSICSYEKFKIASTKPFSRYLWSTGSYGNEIQVDKPGKYWLNVVDGNGCTGADTITVFQKQCMSGVYIPTAFTPDNNGKNDVFKALVFGKVQSFRLVIFDRAGQIVFQTTNPDKAWDGRNNGIPYSTTTFVWQCSFQLNDQPPVFQKGTVILVR